MLDKVSKSFLLNLSLERSKSARSKGSSLLAVAVEDPLTESFSPWTGAELGLAFP